MLDHAGALFEKAPWTERRAGFHDLTEPAMQFLSVLRELDTTQRKVVLASFLGWTLDAFDFFLLVFVIPELAHDFNVGIPEVAFSLTLTLAMRPLGAFIFGRLADRYGRRPVLMVDIVLFAVLEAASALAPSLAVLLVVRALFGIAMGGEWGIGASLAMESIPAKARGAVSGLLQEGYAVGYLIGGLCYIALFDHIGWRGMFALGILPALLVFYIRRHVPESPVWEAGAKKARVSLAETMRGRWRLFAYLVLLMTAFTMFSHGSQDLYPTFLKQQLHFDTRTVGMLTVVLNLGAILGGLFFGALSQRIGRRKRDRHRLAACAADDPALDVRRLRGDARNRRLPASDHGAGRVGRGAGASQRALAGCGARHAARFRVPGRQPARVVHGAVHEQVR